MGSPAGDERPVEVAGATPGRGRDDKAPGPHARRTGLGRASRPSAATAPRTRRAPRSAARGGAGCARSPWPARRGRSAGAAPHTAHTPAPRTQGSGASTRPSADVLTPSPRSRRSIEPRSCGQSTSLDDPSPSAIGQEPRHDVQPGAWPTASDPPPRPQGLFRHPARVLGRPARAAPRPGQPCDRRERQHGVEHPHEPGGRRHRECLHGFTGACTHTRAPHLHGRRPIATRWLVEGWPARREPEVRRGRVHDARHGRPDHPARSRQAVSPASRGG
jgi:hypothetical protein